MYFSQRRRSYVLTCKLSDIMRKHSEPAHIPAFFSSNLLSSLGLEGPGRHCSSGCANVRPRLITYALHSFSLEKVLGMFPLWLKFYGALR